MPSSPTADPTTALTIDQPVDQVYISTWDDPLVDAQGHDPRSSYVEQFWLGILGPSTIWLLRHCRHELDRSPAGFVLDLPDAAGALGLGHKGGRNSALARSLARACRFEVARPTGSGQLEVRRRLPALTRGQLGRLPPVIQRRHELHIERAEAGDHSALQRRARRLALGLIECGDAIDDAELQLGHWRFHPAIAAEAVRWAWDRHHGEGPR
ncbi:MAG: hypothetical protein ACI9C1_003551 [Candidatus Aldehydirespiratoraceae bacterium]|jgi:hypothetical protein